MKDQIQQRIREAIQVAGLSFKDAAERAGIPEQTLRKWVQGVTVPKVHQFSRLAALEINLNYVLTGKGPPVLPRDDNSPSGRQGRYHSSAKKLSRREEEILLDRHRYLVGVLEHAVISLDSIEAALWRFYWALILDKEPLSADLAVIGALYFRTNDFLSAAEELNRELKKDWNFDPKVLEKGNFPIKSDQLVESDVFRPFRFAAADLVDLYKQKKLPSVCLVHHKVHWAGCPVCEGKNA